jgi:hypothetical protein
MEDLIVDALAVARLTRLLLRDGITEPLRVPVRRWAGRRPPLVGNLPLDEWLARPAAHPKVAELLDCAWCASVWVAGAVLFARYRTSRAWQAAATVLALSQVAGMLDRE